MGRMHDDGNLEILGRRDFQVQLRGIRVELAGIENTVRELGLAAQCAVVVEARRARRAAGRVRGEPAGSRRSQSFRKELVAQLPDYMLPQGMVVLEALPVTPNGKLDRAKLQELPWQPPQGAAKKAEKSGEKSPKVGRTAPRPRS